MAVDPTITEELMSWDFDSQTGYSAELSIQDGYAAVAENTPTGSANGVTMTDPTWTVNDSSGVGVCYGESFEPNAPDHGSYKIELDVAGVPKFAYYGWAGTIGENWCVHSFWWNDGGVIAGDDRIGFICDYEPAITPGLGLFFDPNHATPAFQTKYLLRYGGLGSPTDVNTGVTRTAGWHHGIIIGRTIDLGGTPNLYYQILALFIDGTRVVVLKQNNLTLDTPDSTTFGVYYDDAAGVGYDANPLYLDTLKHWIGLRYKDYVSVYLPDARPASVRSITSLAVDADITGQDIGGTYLLFFSHSTDGGLSFGSERELSLANLQAETWNGNGQDVIRIRAALGTTAGGFQGILSPRINQIQIGYAGVWDELNSPAEAWTEMVSPAT